MRIKDGFVLRTIIDNYIVVGEGLSQINFNKIISLNATAAYLWESVIGNEFSCEDLKALLLEKYEVEPDVAQRDASALVESWTKAGLIEE